jgi:hypothetical protein
MKSKQTEFLEKMEGIISWAELIAVIEPHYHEGCADSRHTALRRKSALALGDAPYGR